MIEESRKPKSHKGCRNALEISFQIPLQAPRAWRLKSLSEDLEYFWDLCLRAWTTELHLTCTDRMSPSLIETAPENGLPDVDKVVLALRKALTTETVPLARRFRALFSLKHLACQPPSPQTSAAIDAIAAAFVSPSALLKHELAYCLGQTKNLEAVPYLRAVLEDRGEDAMCRHEAAEALGALGDTSSLDIMRLIRDDKNEPTVVRETCDIAVDRIMWENSDQKKAERLKERLTNAPSLPPPMRPMNGF
jgi:deoxyhypusine monooxygenase